MELHLAPGDFNVCVSERVMLLTHFIYIYITSLNIILLNIDGFLKKYHKWVVAMGTARPPPSLNH